LLYTTLIILIAAVWLINGLYCKLLNLVPRHRLIVARILGSEHATLFTKTIGVLEIGMSAWVISGLWPYWCAWLQIGLVAIMNTIEFFLARDLLLFGKLNAVIATIFILLIYVTVFLLPGMLT
jgi:uncharacterized membrane protein YphA (DoxX/SURF4 family)